MAKIQPSHLISSISGKLCKKDKEYVAYNKKTGQMYSAVHHSYGIQPNSEKQQAVKAEFKTKSQTASAWWRENKASNSDAFKAVMKAYKAQNKIGNPYSFLGSLVTDDLKVILGGKDLTLIPQTYNPLARVRCFPDSTLLVATPFTEKR